MSYPLPAAHSQRFVQITDVTSGSRYVAEVIEEHSALAKKVGQGLIGVST